MIEPRLRLLSSDRLETLADDLAVRMAHEPLSPLDDEIVVVGSRGMARWLNLHLARAHGIAASLETPFPFTWARRTVDRIVGVDDDPALDPFGAGRLPWRIHELLGRLDALDLDGSDRAPLERYLIDDPDGRKRGQLAMRLGRQFVNYQVQRPEGLRRWETRGWFANEALDRVGERWQAALWRVLVAEGRPAMPLSTTMVEALTQLAGGRAAAPVPPRVTVFGVSSLPPVVLELLTALSERAEVTIATVSATAKYVGDAPRQRRARFEDLDVADPAHIHPLLPAWGRLGIDLQEQLLDAADHAELEQLFAPRDAPDVLTRLQQDLFEARMPETPGSFDRPRVTRDDRSLRLHLCHSERREIEVLRDEILRAFEDGVVSSPSDVLVLVPDIEVYAPFVRAVFESARPTSLGELKLPVRIADGRGGGDDAYVRLAQLLLRRAGGRATATDVLEILELEPVARRFGLGTIDGGALRDLVRRAGIRFGRDPQARAQGQDLPALEGGTWREGLDRLVLGFAIGPSDADVDGLVPVGDATTGRGATVGRLARAVDTVFARLDGLTSPRSLAAWSQSLTNAVVALTDVANADDASDRVDLATQLGGLARLSVDDSTVARSTFDQALRALLEDDASGRGFVSGSITVAELRPMRSIPYRMIAVAGLDSDSFPRRDPAEGLDLVVAHPRRGDRTPRLDDRQMMLEVITAARERLVLSAVGFQARDNTERARSVCVDELMEAIDRSFATDDTMSRDTTPGDALTVRHRLQPFHSAYGEGTDHFTYDEAVVDGARALASPGDGKRRFVDTSRTEDGLERDGQGRLRIALDDLALFWKNPSKWFVKNVLGMALHYEEEDLDREAFEAGGLTSYRVRAFALEQIAAGTDAVRIASLAERAQGFVSGPSGRLHARRLVESALGDWKSLGEDGRRIITRPVELETETFVIEGALDVVPGRGRVAWLANSQVNDDVFTVALVHHVVFGCTQDNEDPVPWVTRLYPAGGTARAIRPFDGDPHEVLDELVRGFVEGQRRPLRFFPATSREWWKQLDHADPDDAVARRTAWAKCSAAWEGGDFSKGDGQDESVKICTRGADPPVDDDFVRWARVFAPLFERDIADSKYKGDDG